VISIPWALLPISFRILRKEPPNRAPAKREPSKYLLKFLSMDWILPGCPLWSLLAPEFPLTGALHRILVGVP